MSSNKNIIYLIYLKLMMPINYIKATIYMHSSFFLCNTSLQIRLLISKNCFILTPHMTYFFSLHIFSLRIKNV